MQPSVDSSQQIYGVEDNIIGALYSIDFPVSKFSQMSVGK